MRHLIPVQAIALLGEQGPQLLQLRWQMSPGQSGEAHIFPIQDDNLTAELPLRRSILQSTLRQKYRSAGDITHSVTAVLRKDFIGFTRLPCRIASQVSASSLPALPCRGAVS